MSRRMRLRDRREAFLRVVEGQSKLAGRFSDITRIGARGGDGAFSLIFKAYDEQSRKRVALKVFNPDHQKNVYRWFCFQREAELLKQFVGEPDILQWVSPLDSFSYVYETEEFDFEEEFSFYATELAAGDAQSAVAFDEWDWREKLVRFRAMCRAVSRIHGVGVVHRDIKLSNFLTDEDRTLLCDFGTARSLTDGSEPLAGGYLLPVGDTTYAAPELFAAIQDVDPAIYFKSDVYALGTMFFELLTGTPLNPQIFDDSMIGDLARTMNVVPRSSRVRIYDQVAVALETGRILPPLQDFAPDLPRAIIATLDALYRGLCAINYRNRMCDFNLIFLYINRAVIILNNEAAYQSWQRRRELYRRNAELKRLRNLGRRRIGVVV